jgi:glycosyltransferase involved in cell wall biosynthesis
MRIALAGPVHVQSLRPWLSGDGTTTALTGMAGRGGTPATELASGLLRRGYDVVIVSLDATLQSETILGGTQLRVCLGPQREHGRTRDLFRQERAYVRHALQREAADVVHAQWTYDFAVAALSSGLPTVVTVHDWAPLVLRLKPTPYKAACFLLNAVTFVRGRHFTAPSPYLQHKVQRVTRRQVRLIPNGIDDAFFRDRKKPPRRGPPVLLSINNGFGRRKNVHALLQAFPQVRRAWPSSRLRLAGYHYEPDGLAERWARAQGLTAGVDFLGEVSSPTVHEQMDAADVIRARPRRGDGASSSSRGWLCQRRRAVGPRRRGGGFAG